MELNNWIINNLIEDIINKIIIEMILFFDMDGILININYLNFFFYKSVI